MNSTSVTTWLTLPIKLQLDILKLLKWKDQKNMRLVSTHSLALINYLGKRKHHDISDSDSLEELKASTFPFIKSIKFSDLSKPLPILSSTRIMIPKTHQLSIGSKVSFDNVLKLLRYYAKWSKELVLNDIDLPFYLAKSIQLFGSQICLNNIKNFTVIASYLGIGTRLQYHQHMTALGQLLEWAHLPCLKSLYLIVYPNDWNQSDWSTTFGENFTNFLRKNAFPVKLLCLSLPFIIWRHVINNFELFVNVDSLMIEDSSVELNDIAFDHELLKKAFSNFDKLRSLLFFIQNKTHEILVEHLVKINQATLETLITGSSYPYPMSFSWLHKSPYSCGLRCLELSLLQGSTLFEEVHNFKFKLDKLFKLTIMPRFTDHDSDWREPFTKWMKVVTPNLKLLNLSFGYNNPYQLRVPDVSFIIANLPLLQKIAFDHFQLFQPKPISLELENWFNENPQTHITWIENDYDTKRFDCQVFIDRPYTQQPELVQQP